MGVQVAASITDGYYDAGTTGQALGAQADGSIGMTTAALQGTLPTFANPVWSTGPGLYPYLTIFFPKGAQAISGVAYTGSGVSPVVAGAVTADLGGTSLGSVSTGANGYYYFVEQAGTISAGGSPALIYTSSGARLQTLTGTTGGLDIWGQTFIAPTADLTYSTASAATLQSQDAGLLTSAEGSDTTAATLVAGLTNQGYVATGSSFKIDTPQTLTNGLYVETTASGAPIAVAAALTLPGGEGLNLEAGGALAIDAPITVTGVSAVTLAGASYGFDLTAAGFLGSLTFADTASSLTIDGASYTLEDNPADLVAAINANSSGDFALAASGSLGTSASAFIPSFSGDFTGLGHTITGLTITGSSSDTGLFSQQTAGAIRDIGLVGGTVSGGADVGGLVGEQHGGGSITDVYATGAVSGSGSVGGLVGFSAGTISDAYATGAVSGTGNDVGGLAGFSAGTISDAYATGAVSGSGAVGGLVGVQEEGRISDAYATGAVSGSFQVGGLVGSSGGTIADGYWDTGTTGQSPSAGDGTGETTAQLQGTLPTFQNSGLWSTGPGLYPYLTNFFPNGAQAISGYAYSDAGKTAAAGSTVGAVAGGSAFGSASVGANGYYYIFAPAGSAASGATLLAYGSDAATLTTATGTTVQSSVNL